MLAYMFDGVTLLEVFAVLAVAWMAIKYLRWRDFDDRRRIERRVQRWKIRAGGGSR